MSWPNGKLLRVTALCLAGLFAAACSGSDNPAQNRFARLAASRGDVLVAALGDWEGGGRQAWQGFQLAADLINETGGIHGRRITLWRLQTEDDVHKGLALAQEIADNPDTALAVLHTSLRVSSPASTLLAYYGLPMMITKVSSPLRQLNLPLVFRMCPTDGEQLDFLARFCASRGIKRVGTFVYNSDISRLFAATFETAARSHGVDISYQQSIDRLTSEEAMRGLLDQFTAGRRGDAMLFSGPPFMEIRMAHAAAQSGIETPFLGSIQWDTSELGAVVDPGVTPVYFVSCFDPQAPDARSREFVERYRKAYGEVPDAQAAIMYETLRVYALAARQAGSVAGNVVADALVKQKDLDSFFGDVHFNSVGELKGMKLVMKHFTKGRVDVVTPDPKASTP